MKYQSTRDRDLTVSSTRAVLEGLAGDGGLYIAPCPKDFDWKALLEKDACAMSSAILQALLPDFENMDDLVAKGYAGKFAAADLTPLAKVGDRYVLELFHGPTAAFKDVALSLLPRLITGAQAREGMQGDVVILTATSGDTGKAALEGFHDVPGTKIIVFFPDGGVSAVQRLQMVTQVGENVQVCAIRGNFDDAQTGVKETFAACEKKDLPKGAHLSSANSINIGRLAPQVMYYFKAYADLVKSGRIAVGDKVHFVVPTGNFGDILAGYYAKCLGLPVGKLVCASNQNDVLTDFLMTGIYDRRRPFYKTTSPSMDILVSSNLERMLYLLSDGDDVYIAELMAQLKETGRYQVRNKIFDRLKEVFAYGKCSDADASAAIGKVWRDAQYLMDPHTAVGWHVADGFMAAMDAEDTTPVVVLSTASPYKFSGAVLEALGEERMDDEFAMMRKLNALTGAAIPENLKNLQQLPVRHEDVIDKTEIMDYVLRQVEAWEK